VVPLGDLFLVLATQNPVEQEGTYPLPEAQVDRFMLKVLVDYPFRDEERLIMDRMTGGSKETITPVIDPAAILQARETVRAIYVDDKVKDYVLDLVIATREPEEKGIDGPAEHWQKRGRHWEFQGHICSITRGRNSYKAY
jgi:MoxR-like ATPase